MPQGLLDDVGTLNSVMAPPMVIFPIRPLDSVNQSFPSGPAVIPRGSPPTVGTTNSVMAPAGVIRPILFPTNSVNHRFPSGPAAIP